MITVLFFAHLKERLGRDRLSVTLDELKEDQPATEATTVADLRQWLVQKGGSGAEQGSEKGGEQWATALADGATLVAVNQTMANNDTRLASGDEVAFFPPVTGG